MKERLNLVSGELHIDSQPGAGTRVLACVPIEPHIENATSRSASVEN
jgi:hypothetical protein